MRPHRPSGVIPSLQALHCQCLTSLYATQQAQSDLVTEVATQIKDMYDLVLGYGMQVPALDMAAYKTMPADLAAIVQAMDLLEASQEEQTQLYAKELAEGQHVPQQGHKKTWATTRICTQAVVAALCCALMANMLTRMLYASLSISQHCSQWRNAQQSTAPDNFVPC